MRPTVEELATLVAVVTARSVTGAAARLRLPKSVVSRRIRRLEEETGVSLFRRDGRRIVPTEAGLSAFERASAILPQLDAFSEDLSTQAGGIRGAVRVSAPMSFGVRHLAPLVTGFMAQHPLVEVCLDLDDRIINLSDGQYDLAFRIGRLGDSAVRARRLATSRRAVYCSPGYAARRPPPTRVAELEAHPCLGYGNASSRHVWTFDLKAGGGVSVLVPPARLLSNSGDALLQAAVAGLGLAALPAFLAAEAQDAGRLVEVALADGELAADGVYAVYPETVALPPKVRALIEHVAGALRPPLPWERTPPTPQA